MIEEARSGYLRAAESGRGIPAEELIDDVESALAELCLHHPLFEKLRIKVDGMRCWRPDVKGKDRPRGARPATSKDLRAGSDETGKTIT